MSCHLFFNTSFFPFFLPVHPTPPQAISSLKSPLFGTSELVRGKVTCRGWVWARSWDGVASQGKEGTSWGRPTKKRRNFVQKWRAKQGEVNKCNIYVRITCEIRYGIVKCKWIQCSVHVCVSLPCNTTCKIACSNASELTPAKCTYDLHVGFLELFKMQNVRPGWYFLKETLLFCRKTRLSARPCGGLRIRNGSLFLNDRCLKIEPDGMTSTRGWPFTLRSGTAEIQITAVAFTACGGWQFFFEKNEMRKLDIFQAVSNVSLVAEAGVRKKSASMRKLKLRNLNAENFVN